MLSVVPCRGGWLVLQTAAVLCASAEQVYLVYLIVGVVSQNLGVRDTFQLCTLSFFFWWYSSLNSGPTP
jgi:hypothetical protein